MAEKPVLKWLFRVQYSDDSTYNQAPDDQSVLDEKRSEFYDVLQVEEKGDKKMRFFSLCEVGTNNVITVDLGSGLFFVNKLPVKLEGQPLPKMPEKFSLIFYRQWQQQLQQTVDLKENKVIDQKELPAFCEYFIGWECEIAGKKYTQKMAVS